MKRGFYLVSLYRFKQFHPFSFGFRVVFRVVFHFDIIKLILLNVRRIKISILKVLVNVLRWPFGTIGTCMFKI